MRFEEYDLPVLELANPPRPSISALGVLRDVLIVYGLTFLGGCIIGIMFAIRNGRAPEVRDFGVGIQILEVLLLILGFTISGCLARGNRWVHLSVVALIIWGLGFTNVLYLGQSIAHWIANSFIIAMAMGMGAGLSFLVKNDLEPEVAQ